ncbi:MAG: hypothetical protein KDD92_15815 [Caldilineaceae bacterium]|nr:hypothetical protein [Caldilineaceae bacterium]
MSDSSFLEELNTVRRILTAGGDALEMPLRGLVQTQIERLQPEIHAAAVLATATAADEDETLRQRRIYLAAALEMLYVALNIHKLLLRENLPSPDKSLLGGTILAGDYCFSRAAHLAVQTDHPQVVEIFSQALKEASEGNLRHLFQQDSEPFNEHETLCRSGVLAGAALLNRTQDDPNVQAQAVIVNELVQQFETGSSEMTAANLERIEALPAYERQRLYALQQWLVELTVTSSPD